MMRISKYSLAKYTIPGDKLYFKLSSSDTTSKQKLESASFEDSDLSMFAVEVEAKGRRRRNAFVCFLITFSKEKPLERRILMMSM